MKDNYLKYDWPKYKKPCNTCFYKMAESKIWCDDCIHYLEQHEALQRGPEPFPKG